jgi:Caspase domain
MRRFDPGKSRAVFIGVSQYQHMTQIPCVDQSVLDLVALLSDPRLGQLPSSNYQVLINPADIDCAGDAINCAADAAEDMLLVYYAGHGISGLRRGDLYLGLPRTRPTRPAFTAIQYELIREVVLESRAEVRLVILDCCFSGRAAIPALSPDPEAIKNQLKIEGAYILTASPANDIAVAGRKHTAFTGELIALLYDGIPSSDEMLTLEAVYTHLRRRMHERNLPEPQRLMTASADQLALVPNRACRGGPKEADNTGQASVVAPERIAFERTMFAALQERQAKFRRRQRGASRIISFDKLL